MKIQILFHVVKTIKFHKKVQGVSIVLFFNISGCLKIIIIMVANGGQGNGEEGQRGKIQVEGLEASCYLPTPDLK